MYVYALRVWPVSIGYKKNKQRSRHTLSQQIETTLLEQRWVPTFLHNEVRESLESWGIGIYTYAWVATRKL